VFRNAEHVGNHGNPQAAGEWARALRLASDLSKTDLPLRFGGNGHFSAVSMRERSAAHEGEAL
jgi:hypothetical protein